MIVIGISGTQGAGKGTIVDYLDKEYGFAHFSATVDVLKKRCKEHNLPLNRNNYIYIANYYRARYGAGYIAEELYAQAKKKGKNAVIEHLMAVGEIDALRAKGQHFYLFSLDADIAIRYKRIVLRAGEKDHVSFREFKRQEDAQMESDNPSSQNIRNCMALADYKLTNDGTVEELYTQIDAVMKKLKIASIK